MEVDTGIQYMEVNIGIQNMEVDAGIQNIPRKKTLKCQHILIQNWSNQGLNVNLL